MKFLKFGIISEDSASLKFNLTDKDIQRLNSNRLKPNQTYVVTFYHNLEYMDIPDDYWDKIDTTSLKTFIESIVDKINFKIDTIPFTVICGYFNEELRITHKYYDYVYEWEIEHSDPEFADMEPKSISEWLDTDAKLLSKDTLLDKDEFELYFEPNFSLWNDDDGEIVDFDKLELLKIIVEDIE